MPKKILLVENDRDILALATEILLRANYEVIPAHTVADATARLAGRDIAMVVTDFNLGSAITGAELVQAVRRDQPGTPLIMITGNVPDLPEWLLTGPSAVRVIPKPFSFMSLLEAMKAEFEQHRAVERPTPVEPVWPAMIALPKAIETLVHQVVNQESIVAVTDRKGLIVYANDRFCEISGYRRHELIGQNHRLLKSGQHPPIFYKQLWATILNGKTWRGEICNRSKDGRLYYVDSMIAPLSQAGVVTHFIALRTDVTERRLAVDALAERDRRSEDERRMTALGRMAEGVLHDLSNILTGVIGMAEIELGTQGGPLQEAINRMVQLTHTLRDYTAGRPKKAAPFRLKPLLTSACSLIRHRENASAQLKLHEQFTALTDIEVVGNEGQIFEVVLNLLVNAVEATAGLPVPEIRVRTSLADGRVTVTVEDNGRGVPPSIAIAIFDPYASTKGRGRGLGLSVSRQIAHAHHGELRLAPAAETAGGACFQLELPARAIATGLPFAKDPAPAAKRFILVTEDDPDVQRLIERAVGDIGLQVIWHRPGEALPRILHRSRESLAAAVVDSGDLNAEHGSVAALRQLSPSLPILSISAALEDRGKRMTKWGVVEHLPKPFDSDDFVEALYAALTNTGLDAAAPPGPTAHPTSR